VLLLSHGSVFSDACSKMYLSLNLKSTNISGNSDIKYFERIILKILECMGMYSFSCKEERYIFSWFQSFMTGRNGRRWGREAHIMVVRKQKEREAVLISFLFSPLLFYFSI
jgi:hypothetical protein